MTDGTAFSVVIPTYQRRDLVCEAVAALCRCEHDGPVELFVVVDGSLDGTAEALRALPCALPLTVIEQANAGAASARNRGAAAATGDILLFLDDDMIAAPDLIARHAQSHAGGADAVVGHVPLDPASPPSPLTEAVAQWAEDRCRRLRDGGELTLFDLLTGQLSVKRALFEELGGFDTRFTSGGAFGNEDLDFGVRLLERSTLVFNPLAVSHQRYVVTPRAYVAQWSDAGRADVVFARKHPAHAQALFDLHGAGRWPARFLFRPLAAAGGLARLLGRAALGSAQSPGLPARWRGRLIYVAREMFYWAAVRAAGGMPPSGPLLVLCYHAIADLSGDPVLADYGIRPERFERQLDQLAARGFVFITPDAAAAWLERRTILPRKAVLLTFDDCYEELPQVARDILEPRGVRAIAFAVSGLRSGTNEWDQAIGARTLRLLDAAGLRQLAAHGVEIGCHSRTHRSLPMLDDGSLVEETAGAAEDLAGIGLPRPRFFAYPYGESDDRSRSAVQNAGFVAAFGLRSAQAVAAPDRFNFPRLEIRAFDGGAWFRLKTAMPAFPSRPRISEIAARLRAGAARARRGISQPKGPV